jgi:hypothetical protein
MKQTFKQKYQELYSEVYEQLNHLVNTKGKKSEFRSTKALKVKDAVAFNLDGGRYLKEVISGELIDNEGYSYSFWCLTLEQMCELVDSFK